MNRREFDDWLRRVETLKVGPANIQSQSWLTENNKGSQELKEFIKLIDKSFGNTENYDERQFIIVSNLNIEFEISPSSANPNFILKLTIQQHQARANLSNFSVKTLETLTNNATFVLTNLCIENLIIRDPGSSFIIDNCCIGTLNLNSNCARDFDVRGGIILNISCPPPTGENPFTGSVHFDHSVYFPRKSGKLLKGPQPYRNMRSHLVKLENAPMASLFHRLEQLVERENQGWFDRALSRSYSVLSNYGSSSLRPLIYFMSLFFVTFIVIFLNDGAGYVSATDLFGWQMGLVGGDCAARVERAFTLASQATLNPFGVFGTKGLLVAKYGWLQTWLTLHGVSSALFIALFIFAVRRRFKIT